MIKYVRILHQFESYLLNIKYIFNLYSWWSVIQSNWWFNYNQKSENISQNTFSKYTFPDVRIRNQLVTVKVGIRTS